MSIFSEISGDLDKLDEITFREWMGDEALEALRNTTVYFTTSSKNPDIVNFIYINHHQEPEIVKYRKEDLSNALAVLGAVNTYYDKDVTDDLTSEELESYREMYGTERITLRDAYHELSISLSDIKELYQGTYFVEVEP